MPPSDLRDYLEFVFIYLFILAGTSNKVDKIFLGLGSWILKNKYMEGKQRNL